MPCLVVHQSESRRDALDFLQTTAAAAQLRTRDRTALEKGDPVSTSHVR
jgi:hypothetical protein